MGKGKQENGWSDWNVWRGKDSNRAIDLLT